MGFLSIFSLLLIAIVVILFIKGFKVVKQAEVMVIEFLGQYKRTITPGLQFIIPFLENPRGINYKTIIRTMNGDYMPIYTIKDRIDLRESVYDFPPQNVITKDNVTISIDALLYFQIVDPKSAVYEIANLPEAIEKLTQTTLRNVIGELDLDQALTSRDTINAKLRNILDEATNKWGVKINRVELKDIKPPKEIQTAMEKQMKAERDRRAAILEAEGLKRAQILNAEGVKESEINRAQGEKQAAILRAEGNASARIKQSEAEAQAIKLVIDAIAQHGPADKYLIAMKYLETLKGITEGENNKVVYMPYEATGILSSIDGIKQMLDSK